MCRKNIVSQAALKRNSYIQEEREEGEEATYAIFPVFVDKRTSKTICMVYTNGKRHVLRLFFESKIGAHYTFTKGMLYWDRENLQFDYAQKRNKDKLADVGKEANREPQVNV